MNVNVQRASTKTRLSRADAGRVVMVRSLYVDTIEHTLRAMPNSRIFLDIDIDSHRAKYERARAFVEATDLRYGFTSKEIAELGGGEKQRIYELYENDFEWYATPYTRRALEPVPCTVRPKAWRLHSTP